MYDPMIVAGAVVIVIGALSAAVVSIIAAMGKMRSEIIEISKKASIIESQGNSAATRADATRAALESQVTALKETITKMEKTALLLAQSTALNPLLSTSPSISIPKDKGGVQLETEELKIIKKDKK